LNIKKALEIQNLFLFILFLEKGQFKDGEKEEEKLNKDERRLQMNNLFQKVK
jgi:hypothetical protein